MSLQAFLIEKASATEQAMHVYLDAHSSIPKTLRDAMAYSLFAGGKRLRPSLVLGAAELISGDATAAMPVACALEMIHTYSLIHDDLPAMDDDDLRRGRPTSHKVYGEAVAILAGDALLTLAFGVAAETGRCDIVREIAQAAGAEGMVGGQVIDLEGEDTSLTLDELRRLHACKTGALIRCAVRCGALMGDANGTQLEALTRYGEAIGLAFQIADDILDVVSTTEVLGKAVGSDEANRKSTYPALVGLEKARMLAEHAVAEAIDALESFGPEADTFRALARYIVERES